MENEDKLIDDRLLKVGILGPLGTYTHHAALMHYGEEAEIIPYSTIDATLAGVEVGEVYEGVVPEENIISGLVLATIRGYWERDVHVVGKVKVPIRHYLGAYPGATTEDIEEVLSKQEALDQCVNWLYRNLPNAEIKPVNSTAYAAGMIREERDMTKASIASEKAIREARLDILAEDIVPYNETGFSIIRTGLFNPGLLPEQTGNDETMIAVQPSEDYAGQLLAILNATSGRGINLHRIESRNEIKEIVGTGAPSDSTRYRRTTILDMTLDGHYRDNLVRDALEDIRTNAALPEGTKLKVIGSYQREAAKRPEVNGR